MVKKVVLKSIMHEVVIHQTFSECIYAFKDLNNIIYKLHSPRTMEWSWCSFKNSTNIHTTRDTLQNAIKAIIDNHYGIVYQFDTQQDFVNWCYEETRGKL